MSLEAALEELSTYKHGDHPLYAQLAKKYGVERSTLSRRHRAVTGSQEHDILSRQKVTPQQEAELLKHIEELTKQRLPPTRAIIQNFASLIVKNLVSKSWVTRFLNRHKDDLTSRWNNAMDFNCHKADSYTKYAQYFELLTEKIT
jgi:hypothetical protein